MLQAISGLTEGLYTMFEKRLDLLRHELVDESRSMGQKVLVLVIGGTLLFMGYGLLNLALLLLSFVLFEALWVVTLVAFVLALGNAAGGAFAVYRSYQLMVGLKLGLDLSRSEFERDRKWLNQLRTPQAEALEVTAQTEES